MTTIAFFNNKSGVGKTSLVYHIAWMFSELDLRVVAADLDPQASLSGMFVEEDRLEQLWKGENGSTIDRDIEPLFAGTGDITEAPYVTDAPHIDPYIERRDAGIGLLAGDMGLSRREDEFATEWPKCHDQNVRAFRVMTAFSRLLESAAKDFHADVVLIDVGPNLGAINRAALIASDFVVVPLAPDLFSLQGLRNVGLILGKWRKAWRQRIEGKPVELDIELPEGEMEPLGYIVMRHSVRLDRPVKACNRWIEKIPETYRQSFADEARPAAERCLAHLRDYRSLMPLAQEARKPMFMLKPGDGAIGAQQAAVRDCYRDFRELAKKLLAESGIREPGAI